MASEWYNKFKEKLSKGKDLTKEELQNAIKNDGFDLNEKDEDGHTLCMWAAWFGKTDTVKVLKKQGADVNAKNEYGMTACIVASWNGKTDTVRILVKELKADVNAKDNDGQTACMWAARNDQIEIVCVLVEELGADIDAQDKVGQTACMKVALFGKTDTLLELVRLGADISIKNNLKHTLLDLIDDETKKQVLELRREYEENHPEATKMADDLAKIYLPEVAAEPVSFGPHTAKTKGAKEAAAQDRVPQK